MTPEQRTLIRALAACRFSPGSTAKRFVLDMARRGDDYEVNAAADAFLDKLAHQYRKQLGRCMSVTCVGCHPPIDRETVRVALDALIEDREVYIDDHHVAEFIEPWRKVALTIYNATHGTRFAHPYEYATRVAANNRRAHHRGDVYCRFCGELLLSQVKQPHQLVAGHTVAQRHLTICALQVVAGMRAPAKPGHRTMPMEQLWG